MDRSTEDPHRPTLGIKKLRSSVSLQWRLRKPSLGYRLDCSAYPSDSTSPHYRRLLCILRSLLLRGAFLAQSSGNSLSLWFLLSFRPGWLWSSGLGLSLLLHVRLPTELRCVASLMPLHSAIASARLRSSLAMESQLWGLVPQGL